MRLVRVWLPLAVIAGGLVMIALEPNIIGAEGGAMMIGAGLSVWLLNWLYRVGVAGERDREREERARAYFDRHGRWPDDPPSHR